MSDKPEAVSVQDEKIARIVAHLIRNPCDHWRVVETVEDLDFNEIERKARELEALLDGLLVKATDAITRWITEIPLDKGERVERIWQVVDIIGLRLRDIGVHPSLDETRVGWVQVNFYEGDVSCELHGAVEKAGIELYGPEE
jgi:hypothetical protein